MIIACTGGGGYKVSPSLDYRMWGFIRSNRYFSVVENA